MQLIENERDLRQVLPRVLAEIPFLDVSVRPRSTAAGPDLILQVDAAGTHWTLICELKWDLQPRHARNAIYQLRHYLNAIPSGNKYPVLVGSYISPDTAELLRSESIGFADLAGNCWLSFDKVFIERSGKQNPFFRRRKQRSLFAPKSARALILLLQEPQRWWKTTDLAESAQVSGGHISNVKRALLDREWAQADERGFRIIRPEIVLDAWRAAYEKRAVGQSRYYTPLHGQALENAVRAALSESSVGEHAVLSSFSAARWMAPFARVSTTYFYANAPGEKVLRSKLQLEPVTRGENVIVESPKDEGLFTLRVEAAPGIWTTHPIQTYLDLSTAGDRGAEAADHLRSTKIAPTWKGVE